MKRLPNDPSGTCVDETHRFRHCISIMRRFWLTLLMFVALTASGFASAVAAQSCPFLNDRAPMHDCDSMRMNDSNGSTQDQTPARNPEKMAVCYLGQACRSVPVVAPALEPLRVSFGVILQPRLLIDAPAPATGSVRDFWRPPRSI
mgnify:CR=1 FL=1